MFLIEPITCDSARLAGQPGPPNPPVFASPLGLQAHTTIAGFSAAAGGRGAHACVPSPLLLTALQPLQPGFGSRGTNRGEKSAEGKFIENGESA